ncbi:MAG TPA: PilZ domain-containing protein [Candidatus Acidoferrales bacterium]|nr:PilZ domain-containing protein [Candidatus Acidoferrales bacterium]
MASAPVRRSDRVSLTLLLEASGKDAQGKDFKEPARTLLINRTGAVIILERELAPEQQIHLQRRAPAETHRQSQVRVVGQFGRQKEGFLYGIELPDPSVDLWGIEFPEAPDSLEAVARMLVECSYCRSREVVHLNELELRAFETNRGIARHCKVCGVPSIWTQAPHEDEKKITTRATRGRRGVETQAGPPKDGEQRVRQRVRLHTRLTACVRQPGSDDELAVCEDISPLGMCFRSKRRYESGAMIEVAVPYSPDAANIFLPATVVYSEQMPKAGLFRHGTEYRRVGARTA